MSGPLEHHFSYLEDAIAEARAAPLSLRKARLAIALLDAYVDRLYAADPARAEDILAFRTHLAHSNPALALLLGTAGAPNLKIQPLPLTPSDYPHLSEPDFMVSLYNAGTVPRLLLIDTDGQQHDIQEVLAAALAALTEL